MKKYCIFVLFLIGTPFLLSAKILENRQETWMLSSEIEVSCTYDWKDNCVQWTDWIGTTSVSYNEDDHVQEVTSPDGRKTSYRHDARGCLREITYPSGLAVSYGYLFGRVLRSIRLLEKEIVYSYSPSEVLP